jgi:hypothetical protein
MRFLPVRLQKQLNLLQQLLQLVKYIILKVGTSKFDNLILLYINHGEKIKLVP